MPAEYGRAPRGSPPGEVTGRRIREHIEKLGLSYRAAAKQCGLPVTTLRRYCIGDFRPSVSAMAKLEALGLTEERVFGKRAVEERADLLEDESFIEWYRAQPKEVRARIRAAVKP